MGFITCGSVRMDSSDSHDRHESSPSGRWTEIRLVATVKRLTDLPETAQLRLATLCASITIHGLWSAHTKLNWLLELTRESTPQFCARMSRSIRQQLTEATQEVVSKCGRTG